MARRALTPFRRLRCKGAYAVIERRASNQPWLEVGQSVPLIRCESNRKGSTKKSNRAPMKGKRGKEQ